MNVKPGDLALVMSPNVFAGATCTVLAASVPGRDMPFIGEPYWLCEFPRPMPWANVSSWQPATHGSMPDAHLRRLAGPDIDVDVEVTREEIIEAMREVFP